MRIVVGADRRVAGARAACGVAPDRGARPGRGGRRRRRDRRHHRRARLRRPHPAADGGSGHPGPGRPGRGTRSGATPRAARSARGGRIPRSPAHRGPRRLAGRPRRPAAPGGTRVAATLRHRCQPRAAHTAHVAEHPGANAAPQAGAARCRRSRRDPRGRLGRRRGASPGRDPRRPAPRRRPTRTHRRGRRHGRIRHGGTRRRPSRSGQGVSPSKPPCPRTRPSAGRRPGFAGPSPPSSTTRSATPRAESVPRSPQRRHWLSSRSPTTARASTPRCYHGSSSGSRPAVHTGRTGPGSTASASRWSAKSSPATAEPSPPTTHPTAGRYSDHLAVGTDDRVAPMSRRSGQGRAATVAGRLALLDAAFAERAWVNDPCCACRRSPCLRTDVSDGDGRLVPRGRGWDPADEGRREAILTLGNGRFATRGAAPESRADGVHYPGTYAAGCSTASATTSAASRGVGEHGQHAELAGSPFRRRGRPLVRHGRDRGHPAPPDPGHAARPARAQSSGSSTPSVGTPPCASAASCTWANPTWPGCRPS